MANNKSARKRIRVSEQKKVRNRPFRTVASTYVTKAELAIRKGDQSLAA
ncbi:MAG: 30S ribosomal protein S20, partial [Thermomicrobiales bacterium]